MSQSPPVWENGAWPGLPPLDGAATADVCVIGLGGSGLACVHELLELGVRVIGIDAAAVASGAAGRNGGFLLAGCYHFYHDAVARYGRDRARSIYQLTLAQLDRMAQETPAAVRRTGSLRLAGSPEEQRDCAAQLAAMRADELRAEWYSGPEGDGVLIPSDAVYDPLARARLLAERARSRGARLHEYTAALAVDTGSVVTQRGSIRCAAVVVALDGGLARLLPGLGGRVRTARLQMLATAPAPEVSIPRPVYTRWGFDYWQQLPDGRIALGGCRDLGGDAEWTDSVATTPLVQDALERRLRGIGVTAPVTHRWAASVSYTDDGLPVLDEVLPQVWAVGAYSGTGNVIGAICGRAAARVIVAGDPTLALPFTAPAGARPVPAGAASTGATARSRT